MRVCCVADKHLVELYAGGFGAGAGPARLVRRGAGELCAELRALAVPVADALAPSDFVLNSVLGRSDGKVPYRAVLAPEGNNYPRGA